MSAENYLEVFGEQDACIQVCDMHIIIVKKRRKYVFSCVLMSFAGLKVNCGRDAAPF